MKNKLVYVIVLTILPGCDRTDLFQAPERRTPPSAALKQPLSTLTLATRIPYSAIRAAIDSRTPAAINFSGNKDDCLCADHPAVGSRRQCAQVPYVDARGVGTQEQCINVPAIVQRRACAGCSWDGTITKEGGIELATANNAITISQLLHLTGKAGVRGDLASILSLSGKNFEARFKPTFDMTANLDQNWCPIVGVTARQNWVSSASVEVIGRNCIGINLGPLGNPQACAGPANLDLTTQANEAISRNLNAISYAIRGAIPCDAIRSNIAEHWHTYSLPIKLPQGDLLYLNIYPVSAAFSGLVPDGDGLNITISVGAKTKVEDKSVSPTVVPLPTLESVKARNSELKIHLPSTIPYSLLEKSFGAELIGKDFVKQSDHGNILVHVNNFSLYPSGSKLVLGLDIDAELPGRFFNTSGWVYLVGKPVVVNDGTAIRIEDIGYATVLDNKFWDVASIVFTDQILTILRKNSFFDLKPNLNEIEQSVSRQINGANINGLSIKANSSKLSVQQIGLSGEKMTITVEALLSFDASMSAINF